MTTRAGIAEYQIVDRFRHVVEAWRLESGAYGLAEVAGDAIESAAMPGVRLNLRPLWESVR